MIKLQVSLTFPDGQTVHCGEIITTAPDSRGRIQGAFRYDKAYLEDSRSFPLDPIHLPLTHKEFTTSRPEGVHSVFEDALPDDWGRGLIIQSACLSRREQTVPGLLKIMGGDGLGALTFLSSHSKHENRPSVTIHELPVLMETAYRYDAGLKIDNRELQLLFRAGSSPGGARPKALVTQTDASQWMIKFPSVNDRLDLIAIEAATLSLAQASKLTIPEFETVEVGERRGLLVKRFDISAQGGRYHMISMQTLLGADGYYHLDYKNLFNIVKSCSARPSSDLPFLYRQMTFNAAIGNTDDHLKNFCMLHKEEGFRLSPVYDVLPDIHQRREHTLSFNSSYLSPDKKSLLQMGKSLHIDHPQRIIEEVVDAVSSWQRVFKSFGVKQPDIDKLEWGIERRLSKLQDGV